MLFRAGLALVAAVFLAAFAFVVADVFAMMSNYLGLIVAKTMLPIHLHPTQPAASGSTGSHVARLSFSNQRTRRCDKSYYFIGT